jgi:predicted metal-dependent peptidase
VERVSGTRETAAADIDMGKLLAARRAAVSSCPYLATALHAMSIVPTYDVPTMGVDRYWRCYVSPAFVASYDVPELAYVWLHEVAHLVRNHHARADALRQRSLRHGLVPGTPALDPARPRREQLRLNLAMDCEINDDLSESITVPDAVEAGAITPRRPRDAVTPTSLRVGKCDLFEQYVRELRPEMLDGRLSWLDCGSGAHGGYADWELGQDGAQPLGEHEAAAIRIRVRDAIRRGRGTEPAGWKRWAEGVAEPMEDWRTLLGAAFRACLAAAGAGAADYSYRRPGRRTPSLGGRVILPSLRRPLPQVAVVVDTSGSASDRDLGSALSEVAGISRAVGIYGNRIAVYSCDAAVHTVQRVCAAEEITLVGGGGTDLRKGIDRAMATAPRPDVTVVLTDGGTPWPARAPDCRVVAGIFGSRPRYHEGSDQVGLAIPDWVETVYLRLKR